jgi:hypothetical protein
MELPTAKEAYQSSNKGTEETLKKELELVTADILSAIKEGHTGTFYPLAVSKRVVGLLRGKGYKVAYHEGNDEEYTHITWDEYP